MTALARVIDGGRLGIKRMGRTVASLTLVLAMSCGGISTRTSDGSAGAAVGGAPSPSGSSATSAAGVSQSAGTGGRAADGGAATMAGRSSAGTPPVQGGATGSPPSGCGGASEPSAPGLTCRGIKTGAACGVEAQECPCLACGLADMGRRDCTCTGSTWSCAVCRHPESWLSSLPPDAPNCIDQADRLPCSELGQVCQGAPGGEVCACYRDDEGALVWDCDKAPFGGPW